MKCGDRNLIRVNLKMFRQALNFNIFLIIVVWCTGSSGQDEDVKCPNIVSRSTWGGAPPLEVLYQTVPVKYVIITQTEGEECTDEFKCIETVEAIRYNDMENKNHHDIDYNFLVGGDGNIYEGAGWHKVGGHTVSYNHRSIGIAFIGNFSRVAPDEIMFDTVKQLLECGVAELELDRRYRLLGQRQVYRTSNPGMPIFQKIRQWPHWVNQE